MEHSELTALLRLLSLAGATGSRWRGLIHRLWAQSGSLAEALRSLPQQPGLTPAMQAQLRDRLGPGSERDLAGEHAALERLGLSVVGATEDAFPPRLAAIPDPPLALFLAGDGAALAGEGVAVVGSRRASRYGVRFTEGLARELAQVGLVVVSGLAEGIDGAAHRGAVAAGGRTLAVLGSGHERIYPSRHRRLGGRIANRAGALVSEYPPTCNAAKHRFPERNRLISGLALGVVIVEASERSGSLITARLALEQGREVMAVPGPALASSHRGCHRLIREGAALVESCDDVLAVLGLAGAASTASDEQAGPGAGLDDRQRRLLERLHATPVSADELQAELGLPVDELLQDLAMLELKGFVEPSRGGYIRRPS